MTGFTETGTRLRRFEDFPALLISQDYELFFHRSGSIEKCLFEPTDLLLDFAKQRGFRVTFFVDAGMLSQMSRKAGENALHAKNLGRIQRHVEYLHLCGHEIGLHVHPHWEDTRWVDGAWDFSNTRYRLGDFSVEEASDIVSRYAGILNELCDGSVRSYRAGGFCVEPFGHIKQALLENDITIDSSVVPGARLKGGEKGFDFRKSPRKSWWTFEDSPLHPSPDGRFIEIPITPTVLPIYHYWGRALDRALGRQPADASGDGLSKGLGRLEIVRRLAGAGRVSELSVDAAKAGRLVSQAVLSQERRVWQLMGHPKLLGPRSLKKLAKFLDRKKIRRFETLSGFADAIRAGGLSAGPD